MNAFDDRRHAGKALAEALRERPMHEPLLLALPRGGVPVAYEISLALQYPLELLLVRKIGAPGHEEYAVGAVVEGDPPRWVKDEDLLRQLRVAPDWFERRLAEQLREIERRRARYCGRQPLASRRGRDLILVDDGLATGNSVRAALQALREDGPRRIILAVRGAAGHRGETAAAGGRTGMPADTGGFPLRRPLLPGLPPARRPGSHRPARPLAHAFGRLIQPGCAGTSTTGETSSNHSPALPSQ
ncbi:phosphoribosyltransferase [Pseudomonas delhiensis]|uniref:phosphoribosyltransferase n=1 Tax=Pseudomonas delhiensis TaxID=366289 RepID=UPI00315A46AC